MDALQKERDAAKEAGARVRLAFVVQRYGTEVVGGAELHCRWIAEHLAERHQVEVLTTTATDYLTWENVLPAGVSQVNGVTVRRFPVARDAAGGASSSPWRTRSASSSTPTRRSGGGWRSTGR